MDHKELARRDERRQRFLEEQLAGNSTPGAPTLVEARATLGTAVHGQNTSLEKDYFRLTSHPGVDDVRPPHVLSQALALVQAKWKQGCSYRQACDQLKSIRQDLTVQHVRTPLTVSVYETHARVAMEVADWAELRQTLAVLGQLYEELGRTGEPEVAAKQVDKTFQTPGKEKKKKKKKDKTQASEMTQGVQSSSISCPIPGLENHREFMAYNLMLAAGTGRSILAHELKECSARGFLDGRDPFMDHALAACRAAGCDDYAGLLKLYDGAPRMTPYLLDLLVEKTRPKAWSAILAAYGGPHGVPIDQIAVLLGFEGAKEATEWVKERGGVVLRDGNVDVKGSREGLRTFVAAQGAGGATTSSGNGGR